MSTSVNMCQQVSTCANIEQNLGISQTYHIQPLNEPRLRKFSNVWSKLLHNLLLGIAAFIKKNFLYIFFFIIFFFSLKINELLNAAQLVTFFYFPDEVKEAPYKSCSELLFVPPESRPLDIWHAKQLWYTLVTVTDLFLSFVQSIRCSIFV